MLDDVIVGKFGGGTFLHADSHERFAQIMRDEPDRRYFVFSALGSTQGKEDRVTQLLVALARCKGTTQEREEATRILNRLVEKHEAIYPGKGGMVGDEVQRRFNSGLQGPALEAHLKAAGEYLNARLAAECHGLEFIDATALIRLQGDHNHGRIHPATYTLLEKLRGGEGRYALPGFYGLLPDGSIATLAFGGSDTSGAAIARGVNATIYENWTESAVRAAHPTIIPDAKIISVATRQEMRILSYSGMEIIHPEAFKPLEGTPITMHIRDLQRYPEEGTYIVEDRVHDPLHPVLGVGYRRLVAYSIASLGLNDKAGIVRTMLEQMRHDDESRSDPNLQFFFSGVDDVTLVFTHEDVEGVTIPSTAKDRLRNVVLEGQDPTYTPPDPVQFHDAFECVVVAGKGMTQQTYAQVLTALDEHNITVQGISAGPHSPCLVLAVEDRKGRKAVDVIYETFIR